jgi:hypothetical protein
MATFPSKVNYATGDILTATNMNDVGGAINLLESAQFSAGKNKIINGDFGVWQRGTSFTTSVYTADRWVQTLSNTTTTTQQTFTPGTAPVSGYEGTYYLQIVNTTSTGANYLVQRIEDVRQLAGQTVTLSFWAKADSACTIQTYYDQNFGSGGSTQASSATTNTAITTAWARYSITTTLGSMSGKTIGTSSYLAPTIVIPAAAGNRTIGIWGVQLEAASTASNFQTATGTKQGELAACQRYYFRNTPTSAYGWLGAGIAASTSSTTIAVPLSVTMRITPSSVDFSTLSLVDSVTATAVTSCTIDALVSDAQFGVVTAGVASGLTQYRPYYLRQNASASGYIGFNAEL